jgi:hypothetical protein
MIEYHLISCGVVQCEKCAFICVLLGLRGGYSEKRREVTSHIFVTDARTPSARVMQNSIMLQTQSSWVRICSEFCGHFQ